VAVAFLLGITANAELPSIRSDWRRIREARPDAVTRDEEQFRSLIAFLPTRGRIGYLQPPDWPGAAAVRRFYVAQYALAPRLIVMHTEPEIVIVTPRASGASGATRGASVLSDPRLAGFQLAARSATGVRLFRRVK
jgi:hypothetical protein